MNTTLLSQDGDGLHLESVLDNAGGVAVVGRRAALYAGPRAHAAVPPHDRVHDARVVLDLGVLEHDGLLDARAPADDGPRADGHVGAQHGGGIDAGAGVDEDGWLDGGRGRGELLAAVLPGLLQVQGVGGHGGAGRLDLSPEILSFVDEELLAVGHVAKDVLLEADDLALALVVVVVVVEDEGALEVVGGGVGGEAGAVAAALHGALDGGEYDVGAEEVDAAIDEVADVALGLLDVVQDALGVGVGHDAAEIGGGVVLHAGTENDSLGVLLGAQLEHLVEGKGAADVGIQHEEALGLALQDGIAEVVEAAGGAKGLVLAKVFDGELGEGGGGVLEEIAEDGLVVVADEVDFVNGGDFGDGGQAMVDDRVAGDIEEGLRVWCMVSQHRSVWCQSNCLRRRWSRIKGSIAS